MVGDYLRLLWKDKCKIEVTQASVQANGATAMAWTILCDEEPCKLSFYNAVGQNGTAKTERDSAAGTFQQVKLFLRPDLEIPAGSRITVTTHTNNRTLYYKKSGISELFTNHQEINVESVQKWA